MAKVNIECVDCATSTEVIGTEVDLAVITLSDRDSLDEAEWEFRLRLYDEDETHLLRYHQCPPCRRKADDDEF